jgi:hypothetical protein
MDVPEVIVAASAPAPIAIPPPGVAAEPTELIPATAPSPNEMALVPVEFEFLPIAIDWRAWALLPSEIATEKLPVAEEDVPYASAD